jgi:membrane protein
MRSVPKRVFRASWKGAKNFFERDGLVYSAAVAFNILLSAIPVLFLVFATASVFMGKDELPFKQLGAFLRQALPFGAEVLVPNLRRLIKSGAAFGVAGSLLLLAASFSGTGAVHTSLSAMMGRPKGRRIARVAVFHIAFVLCLIVLTAAAVVTPPLWKGISYLIKGMTGGADAAFHLFLQAAADAALEGIALTGSVLSYRYLSPVTVRWRSALTGGVVFVTLMNLIRYGFRFYVTRVSRLSLIYGSLFGIVSFIIVAYLFAAAYLYCASIIGVIEAEEGRGRRP